MTNNQDINLTDILINLSPFDIVNDAFKFRNNQEEEISLKNVAILRDKYINDDIEVINGVIIYLAIIKKGTMPGLKYLIKTYNDFKKKNITNTYKIVSHIKNRIIFEKEILDKKKHNKELYMKK
ncbi:MAG: hypothetical protein WCZ13_01205 [Acholeplasmataceae bacterium]